MLRSVTWSEESEDHIARHGVTPDEVEDVLYGRPRLVKAGRGETTLVLGQTANGRYLLVVHRIGPTGDLDIVTSRTMNDNERQEFRQKGR